MWKPPNYHGVFQKNSASEVQKFSPKSFFKSALFVGFIRYQSGCQQQIPKSAKNQQPTKRALFIIPILGNQWAKSTPMATTIPKKLMREA